jgi:hypothetical protein
MSSQKNIKQLVLEEYTKCAKDPVYFMKKYCQIQHPQRGKILFHLYPFQEQSLKEIAENDYNIILKSRQLGISTLTAGYALWMMIFNSDKNVLVIATKQEVAKNLVLKVRTMHELLPSWLKNQCIEDNKLSLRFKNGSQIKAVSAAADAGRSESLSLLIIDEAAFIDYIDEIWASAQQTLANGGRAIILSTPNGTGNFFHKTWVGAETGENGFNPILLPWTVHPERDQSWRDKQTKLLGEKMASQECDCDFISSGHTVIDGSIIQWYNETYVKEPIEKQGIDSNLWIWEYPDFTKSYIVVADVARGDGQDYSACHVLDIETLTQVAEYKGKLDTKSYGNFLVSLATQYNDALLVIENANIGWAAIQQAIDRNYRNLYYSYKEEGYIDPDVQLMKGYDLKDKSQMVPGFTMSSRIRPLIISKLETYFRERLPVIQSKRLIEEMFVFIWNGSRAEALKGYNDDLVMSMGIALWTRDSAIKLKMDGMELTKHALNNIQKPSVAYRNAGNADNYWKMRVSDKENEDLSWLL